jgi:Putative beta-barrel porin 2
MPQMAPDMMNDMTHGGARRSPVAPDRNRRHRIRRSLARRSLARRSLVWALAAIIPAVGAYAAEWSVETSASLTGKYDDNVRLSPTDKQAVFGAIFAPQLSLRRRSPIWDMSFKADVSISRYTDDPNLNSENPRLQADIQYRMELGEIRLQAEASRSSTLVTEEDEGGNFRTTTQRNLFRLAPSWTYAVSEVDTINIGAGWTEVKYESDALNDYRNLVASAGWSRQVTQADTVNLNLIANYFESEAAIDLQSTSLTAMVGWDHTFSERLKTSVAAGPQYYMTDVLVSSGGTVRAEENQNFGYSLSANVDYELSELTSVGAGVSRQIQPTSSGSPLQRNRLEVNARHQFQPRLSGTLRAFFQQESNPTDDPAANRDREFFSIEPRLTWMVAEDWGLTGSYRFRTQNTQTADQAYSNAVFVTVTYRPQGWVFER